MSRPVPRSSRRAALGLGMLAGAAVLGASGCSPDDAASRSPGAPRTPGTGRRTGAGAAPSDDGAGTGTGTAEDADTALVGALVGALSLAHTRVRANRRAHPPLADRLRALERLHARHAAELGGLVPVDTTAARAEPRRGRVLARTAAAETRLQAQLVDQAVAASSGALALLVAQMAAATAQELTRL